MLGEPGAFPQKQAWARWLALLVTTPQLPSAPAPHSSLPPPLATPRPPGGACPAPTSGAAHGKLEAAGCSQAGRRQGACQARTGRANRLLAVAAVIYEAVWEPGQACKSWTIRRRSPALGLSAWAPGPPCPSQAGPARTGNLEGLRSMFCTHFADEDTEGQDVSGWPSSLGHWPLRWWLCRVSHPKGMSLGPEEPLGHRGDSARGPRGDAGERGWKRRRPPRMATRYRQTHEDGVSRPQRETPLTATALSSFRVFVSLEPQTHGTR